jgi:hypothetical protein
LGNPNLPDRYVNRRKKYRVRISSCFCLPLVDEEAAAVNTEARTTRRWRLAWHPIHSDG